MGPYASQPMPSWLPSALGFPPLSLSPFSEPLQYPEVSGRGAPPVRAARHVVSSIATFRALRVRAVLGRLPCCAWGRRPRSGVLYDTAGLDAPGARLAGCAHVRARHP